MRLIPTSLRFPVLRRKAATLLLIAPLIFQLAPSWAETSSCPRLVLREPLSLTRPMSEAALQRLLDEAESFYRGQLYLQATDAYLSLLELAPGHEMAWLRLGNVQHVLGCKIQAFTAYRQLLPQGVAPSSPVQARGLLNLAILAGDQLEESFKLLDALVLEPALAQIAADLKRRFSAGSSLMVNQAPAAPAALVSADVTDRVSASASSADRVIATNIPIVPGEARGGNARKAESGSTGARAQSRLRPVRRTGLMPPREEAQVPLPIVQYVGGNVRSPETPGSAKQ